MPRFWNIPAILVWLAVVALSGRREYASAQDCGWTQQFPALSPSARANHALAYDSARGVSVLFGGVDLHEQNNGETWEWDGATWEWRTNSGPSPRANPAMSYDSARGVTVLFGGSDRGGYCGDTWEWDGATWTLRATGGPSPRWAPAMAYDTIRGVAVLFGGADPYDDGETWEWDGTTWTLRATDGPSPRMLHAMAYDELRGVTVLFGGHANYEGNGETWEWDGSTWSLRATIGPSPCSNPALAYDDHLGVSRLFDCDGETWDWNGTRWARRATTGPSARIHHAMVHDSARGRTVLFGGAYNDETWEYFPDCNCNGVPDWDDIKNGTSGDRNSNGIPDECELCEFISRFKATTKENRGRCKIRASALTMLPEGTELTLCFDGDENCGCVLTTINARGRAKASCITMNKGEHRVCIQECPDLCRTATCQP
ncbi:MAG: hypothetical protein IT449_15595 [Phycisphaerales bacterium]|nr:hypothetical protein [Phycisphaerales bacterium]